MGNTLILSSIYLILCVKAIEKILVPESVLRRIESLQETSLIEACGVLVGRLDDYGIARVTRMVPTENLLQSSTRFEIDPRELFEIFDGLEGEEEIVAVYHTHPTSAATPSRWDREYMEHATFLWIIAGVDTLAAYLWIDDRIEEVPIECR